MAGCIAVSVFNDAFKSIILALKSDVPGDSKIAKRLRREYRYFDRETTSYIDAFIAAESMLGEDGSLNNPLTSPHIPIIAGQSSEQLMNAVKNQDYVQALIKLLFVTASLYAGKASSNIVSQVISSILGARDATLDDVMDEGVAEAVGDLRTAPLGDELRKKMRIACERPPTGSSILDLAQEIGSNLDLGQLLGAVTSGQGLAGVMSTVDTMVRDRLSRGDIDTQALAEDASKVMDMVGRKA